MFMLICAGSIFLQQALGKCHSDFQYEGDKYVQHHTLCSVLKGYCWCGLGFSGDQVIFILFYFSIEGICTEIPQILKKNLHKDNHFFPYTFFPGFKTSLFLVLPTN